MKICSAQLLDTNKAFLKIRESAETRTPFSFIRIGDGEGVLLSLGENSWIQDFQYLGTHFGDSQVSIADLIRLRDDLRSALNKANLIGIREDILGYELNSELANGSPTVLEREVKGHFSLRPVERTLPSKACRRLALTNIALAKYDLPSNINLTSAWGHWDFILSGDLYRLLQNEHKIGLISCHMNLKELLETFFPLKVVLYQVPKRSSKAEIEMPGVHYPRRFDRLRYELRIEHPGMVFLVGAGICGKVYCQWIKERGGIALDMGAVLDTWVGVHSRPSVIAHKFPKMRPGEVPADLLLNYKTINRLLYKKKSTNYEYSKISRFFKYYREWKAPRRSSG